MRAGDAPSHKRRRTQPTSHGAPPRLREIAPPRRVDAIEFSMLSDEEVIRLGITEIKSKADIMDNRMGSADPRVEPCGTCLQRMECGPGHPGYIKLPFPIYHPFFIDHVHNVLRMSCYFCSHCWLQDELLGDMEEFDATFPPGKPNNKVRYKYIVKRLGKRGTSTKEARARSQRVTVTAEEEEEDDDEESEMEVVAESGDEEEEGETDAGEESDDSGDSEADEEEEDTASTTGPSKNKQPKQPPRRLCPKCSAIQPSYGISPKEMHISITWPRTITSALSRATKTTPAAERYTLPLENAERLALSLQALPPTAQEWARMPFNPARAKSILASIPEPTRAYMGLAGVRLEAWLPEALVVLPTPMRPTIMLQSMSKTGIVDDMTTKYGAIAESANHVRKQIEKVKQWDVCLPPSVRYNLAMRNASLRQHMEKIQEAYYVILLNDNRRYPVAKHHSKTELASFRTLLMRKDGHVRLNMLSKRCNFTGRAVISGDPTLDVDEVGLPEKMAFTFTTPERVTLLNRAVLREAILRGPNVRDGAEMIEVPGGPRMFLKYAADTLEKRRRIELQVGWIVHRHLREGDLVIINRQPSLHKYSIMAHRVRILPGNTMRISMAATSPYNADFDGDEMNVHVVQKVEAQAEVNTLITLRNNVLNAAVNAPCMGPVQDTMTGVYQMTHKDVFLHMDRMHRVMCSMKYVDHAAIPPPTILVRTPAGRRLPTASHVSRSCAPKGYTPLWTGKQLFSTLFHKYVFSREVAPDRDALLDEADEGMVFRNGELLQGQITKRFVGKGKNLSLLHIVALYNGNTAFVQVLSDMQRLATAFMQGQGFTVSLQDCALSKLTTDACHEELVRARDFLRTFCAEATRLGVAPAIIETCADRVVVSASENCRLLVDAEPNARHNSIRCMINAGAKGTSMNMVQISTFVGQQHLSGCRLGATLKGKHPRIRKRVISSMGYHDMGMSARGFVFRSFLKGLSPHEMYFHAMDGRRGVVQSSTSTADTGYTQRKIIESLRNHVVRNCAVLADDHVVQTCYGGDGFDGTRLQKVNCRAMLTCSEMVFRAHMGFPCDSLLRFREALRTTYSNLHFPLLDTKLLMPFELRLLLSTVPRRDLFRPSQDTDSPAFNVWRFVRELWNYLTPGYSGEGSVYHTCEETTECPCHMNPCLPLPSRRRVVLYAAWEMAALRHSLRPAAGPRIVMLIQRICGAARVATGEGVGVVAGHSIGEPITQLTLNTFHVSGQSSSVQSLASQGISRLREILEQSRVPDGTSKQSSASKHAVMTLRIVGDDPAVIQDGTFSRMVNYKLVYFLSSCFVEEDPVLSRPPYTTIHQDEGLLRRATWVYGAEGQSRGAQSIGVRMSPSPFIVRMVLDKSRCLQHSIAPAHILEVLRAYLYGQPVTMLHSCVTDKEWVIRVRYWGHDASQLTEAYANQQLTESLSKLRLGGIQGVTEVADSVEQVSVRQEDGSIHTVSRPVLFTRGSSMTNLTRFPWVDWYRSISNDIGEVVLTLGIRAARYVIVKELHSILGSQGGYVDLRHIELLADYITCRGILTRTDYNGMHHLPLAMLQKLGFERQKDVIMSAALSCETDPITAVAPNVMLTQRVPIGTGCVSLVPVQTGDRSHALPPTGPRSMVTAEEEQQMHDLAEGDRLLQAAETARTNHRSSATPDDAVWSVQLGTLPPPRPDHVLPNDVFNCTFKRLRPATAAPAWDPSQQLLSFGVPARPDLLQRAQRLVGRWTIGKPATRFPMKQPHSLEPRTLQSLSKFPYLVHEKTDGVAVFLLAFHDEVYGDVTMLLPRTFDTGYLLTSGGPLTLFRGSCCEAELVTRRAASGSNWVIVFDAVRLAGVDVRPWAAHERLRAAQRLMPVFTGQHTTKLPGARHWCLERCRLASKRITCSTHTARVLEGLSALGMETDGLVFAPIVPYAAKGHKAHELKWKQRHTIDLRLVLTRVAPGKSPTATNHFLCGGKEPPIQQLAMGGKIIKTEFPKNAKLRTDLAELAGRAQVGSPSSAILEYGVTLRALSHEEAERTGKTYVARFEYIRPRPDKSTPNSLTVIVSTLCNLDITADTVLQHVAQRTTVE